MIQLLFPVDLPTTDVLIDIIIYFQYRNDYFGLTESRAIHNNTVTIVCNRGYVDPITRLSTIESTCQLNEYNEGRWLGAVPDECVIVDCGDPPLGVHAFPPQVSRICFLRFFMGCCRQRILRI